LAGQNVSTISTNVTNAFSDPFPLEDMIRITFVTGAGKLGRQKYDDNAAKALTSALRNLGFEEDRGASCVKECAGSFKLQHDTGKNLKTVVVFPNIVSSSGAGGGTNGGADGSGDDGVTSSGGAGAGGSILEKGSPEELIAMSSKTVFENMVKSRCPSWSQKKGCAAAIASIKTLLGELEQKLLSGTPLSDPEQSFYDSVPATVLDEKQTYVKDQMHEQVEAGILSSREKTQLLSQVTERLEALTKEIAEAEKDQKTKKVEKLKAMQEKAMARKEMLSKISPKGPHRLKHEAEILKMRAEIQPLVDLEDSAKGRLLSLKETQSLARKDEILEEIADLEEKSRGWFEEDDAFATRVEACQAVWNARRKQTKKTGGAKKAAPSSSSSNATSWVTTSISRGPAAKASTNSTGKKKGKAGVFAAMMIDSDSD
jgi:hypothetical protein